MRTILWLENLKGRDHSEDLSVDAVMKVLLILTERVQTEPIIFIVPFQPSISRITIPHKTNHNRLDSVRVVSFTLSRIFPLHCATLQEQKLKT
jgi:hypothetical protein